MTDVRPLLSDPRYRCGVITVVGLALLLSTVMPLGFLDGPGGHPAGASPFETRTSSPVGTALGPEAATSISELGPAPTEIVVGMPAGFAWQALDAVGARVTTFAVDGELTVTESANGSGVRAWANASTPGPLARSANGTFSVPSSAWTNGVLSLTVSVAAAVPVTVRLFGPRLPSLPTPVGLAVLPDLDHLVLYESRSVYPNNGSNDTFWHVRDRFGDPTPGAFLIVEYSTGGSMNKTFVPVTWTTGGTTGAWVNYSSSARANGTFEVMDEANTTLLGPVPPSVGGNPASPSTASLSLYALAAVVLLVVGAAVGMAGLVYGGRPRRAPARTDEEEELRTLAEGRATIVDLVRRAGALGIPEIEAAWEPPPAPPAVADWVASLVTDGTLTISLGEGGRPRFALAERRSAEPRVTLDEDALEEGIARRDAAVERDDGKGP